MQYHAVSLADRARTRRVTLIGYAGERCVPAVETHPKIAQQLMQPVEARWLRRAVPFPVYAALKVLLLFWRLALELAWRTPGPLDAVLVQTPPALPTLIVAWLVCATAARVQHAWWLYLCVLSALRTDMYRMYSREAALKSAVDREAEIACMSLV